MKKKNSFVDDGHTIANMNVEGMPWYNPAKAQNTDEVDKEALTGKETWAMIKGVTGAALLVAAVFAIVFFVIIALFVCIW